MPTLSFRERFAQWFDPAVFTQLARDAHWLRRQGKIHAGEFLLALVFAQWSARRLTLNAQAQGLAEPVSRQAIDQRYTPAAVTFCQAAFAHCLHQTLDWAPAQPLAQELRRHFAAVYLVDSTAFAVPANLATLFPGCGGDASPASAKVLLRYELITGRLEPLQVLPGKRSDQGLAQQVVIPLRENELQLQDKGFFSAAAWQLAGTQKAFLLCPLPRSVTLWHAGPAGPEARLDLAAALAASPADQVEWSALYCGQDPRQFGPVRVVAFRLSPASAQRHRAGLREAQRKQGRTPSATALELAGWLVLVTNAPAAQLPSAALSYLYRMRWQIELIFRQCKSGLRLNVTESANPCRVQCEWWARLLAAVLGFLWHAHAGAASWQQRGCELSFEKTLGILQQWGQSLARAFLVGGEPLRTLLHELWRHLLKHARKGRQKTRTNTWDRLREVWLQPAAAAALLNL
jgi:hypothetical protein